MSSFKRKVFLTTKLTIIPRLLIAHVVIVCCTSCKAQVLMPMLIVQANAPILDSCHCTRQYKMELIWTRKGLWCVSFSQTSSECRQCMEVMWTRVGVAGKPHSGSVPGQREHGQGVRGEDSDQDGKRSAQPRRATEGSAGTTFGTRELLVILVDERVCIYMLINSLCAPGKPS